MDRGGDGRFAWRFLFSNLLYSLSFGSVIAHWRIVNTYALFEENIYIWEWEN